MDLRKYSPEYADSSCRYLLQIVRTIEMCIENSGKVLLHSHQGRKRTGVVACCWLIKSRNINTEAAIQTYCNSRYGSQILPSSLERSIIKCFENCKFWLHQDAQSMKLVFSGTKFGLGEIVKRELQFGLIDYKRSNSALPTLLELIFNRFEVLLESRAISAEKVLRSFYDLDHPRLFSPWTKLDEAQLSATKEYLNLDVTQVSHITDPRTLSQILLDYVEEVLKAPALSELTRRQMAVLIEQSKRGESVDLENFQMIRRIPRSEYTLLVRLRKLFHPFALKNVLETEVNHSLAR